MVSNHNNDEIFDNLSDLDLRDGLNYLMHPRQATAARISAVTLPEGIKSLLEGLMEVMQQMPSNKQ